MLMETLEECGRAAGHFGWFDYSVLALVLVGSCAVGTFYACTGPKQTTSEDFLLGGSSMGTIPTALSLAAGFVTAIELLGNPTEVYLHGTQFWVICFSFIFVVPITSYLYLPSFMKLQLTSSYEYLELRFSKSARVFTATMYLLQMILYTSVAVYAPALALSHVTGLNVYLAVTIVYLICIFYASQGGMKAVIMTDTFQAIVLMASILAVMFIGSSYVGGFKHVYDTNEKSGRIEFFNMNPSPTVRHSFWSVLIGGTFYWATMFCANQSSIQKYLSVETIEQARSALWTSCVGLIAVFSVNFCSGMILYDQYKDCDPLHNNEISAQDELFPFYVMKVQGHLTGIPGLYVSGIFAASLGTVASAVNSLAAVSMKDILNAMFNVTIPDEKGACVSRWLSLFFGVLSFALVFVVERLGSLLQVALSFNGITGGVTLGLFSLGMLYPWANAKGAMAGGLVSFVFVSWMGLGAQITALGMEDNTLKPISIEGCPCLNFTTVIDTEEHEQTAFWLYRVSYLWFSAIGCLMTFFIGVVVSSITGPTEPSRVHPDLISPPVTTLLNSLPNSLKRKLNISLDSKDPVKSQSTNEGIVNQGLSLDSEINIKV